jgi:hypothetical protein
MPRFATARRSMPSVDEGTAPDGPAQSVLAGPTPDGAAEPRQPQRHPHAAAAPEAARAGGDPRGSGVAADASGGRGHKVLSQEGVVWVTPLRVTPSADQTARPRPAAVMGPLFAEVCGRLQAHAPPPCRTHAGRRWASPARGSLWWRARRWKRGAKRPGRAGVRRPGAWRQDEGEGGGLQPPPAVAAVYGGCGRQ